MLALNPKTKNSEKSTNFHEIHGQLFASVEVRKKPELKGLPVIVGSDPKGGSGRGVVSTCSL